MNSFGRIFRLSLFGESHGEGIGVSIDGCPPGMDLCKEDFLHDLSRRKSGSKGTTMRIESDMPELLSGIFKGKTTGSPIGLFFRNENAESKAYNHLPNHPRPGHADFVAVHKFKGFSDYRGGGHFSGRVTLGMIAAGVIAKKILKHIEINAKLTEIGACENFNEAVENIMSEQDSIGGIVECTVKNVPIGYGEVFFDSVESVISHLIFSIPSIKGIEFGAGFKAAKMKGSEHNDALIDNTGKTKSNCAGGINGGITNGNDLIFRVAVKPSSSIGKNQETVNLKTNQQEQLSVKGRHDSCIALRIPVIVEAATAIALADFKLIRQSQNLCHL